MVLEFGTFAAVFVSAFTDVFGSGPSKQASFSCTEIAREKSIGGDAESLCERLREIERPEGIAERRPRARVCFKFASIGCNKVRERASEGASERANEMLD